jgi:hypothetical protein
VEQTGDFAWRKAHWTTSHCEAANLRRDACVGHTSGVVHGVSGCAMGASAMASAATTAATTSVFISSPFRSAGWQGFADGRADSRINAIAGVSSGHKPHRCRRIAYN